MQIFLVFTYLLKFEIQLIIESYYGLILNFFIQNKKPCIKFFLSFFTDQYLFVNLFVEINFKKKN